MYVSIAVTVRIPKKGYVGKGGSTIRQLIHNDLDKCVGCNRCIRICPVEEANVAYSDNGRIKVKVISEKCIACGGCISVCRHGSRHYTDDTDRFFDDLRRGVPISVFAAPAGRTNFPQYGRVLSLLRQLGVRMIYDVSLGADICTWAHIRYIQKNSPPPVITQPCPAIVNYVLMHRTELVKRLSPVHSPMLCTAIYMRDYESVRDRIAALSPCIAKSHEFETTGYVDYNVTFKKLYEYIERHGIRLPADESGFDHFESGLGGLYSQPGGLKENVEYFVGKGLRIDKSEGPAIVYKALDEYAHEPQGNLPAVFDVLNCLEGCNIGTGCLHDDKTTFSVNTQMDARRQTAHAGGKKALEAMYAKFDKTLQVDSFVRSYTPHPAASIPIDDGALERAFAQLDKMTDVDRMFDCGACGSDSCRDMAVKVAKGVNIPENCIEKARREIQSEHHKLLDIQHSNLENITRIEKDITAVKTLSDSIVPTVTQIGDAIEAYDEMAKAINKIALQINIISLNASVEAVRAGEAGRSFEVVAAEIRQLAADSQHAVQNSSEASVNALSSIGAIRRMVGDIGGAVDESHRDITHIASVTREVLSH